MGIKFSEQVLDGFVNQFIGFNFVNIFFLDVTKYLPEFLYVFAHIPRGVAVSETGAQKNAGSKADEQNKG